MLLWFCFLLGAVSGTELDRYVLVTSPVASKISYVRINALKDEVFPAQTLAVSADGVDQPRGICVDRPRSRVFVCDAGDSTKKIYWFDLKLIGRELIIDGGAKVAVQQVEAHWCSVDHVGNLYFTENGSNVIRKVDKEKLEMTDTVAEVIYQTHAELSSPGGIVVDNLHIFWANTALGNTHGSLVRGMAGDRQGITGIAKIAQNADSAHGLCLVGKNLWYLEDYQNVYGVTKTGGPIVPIVNVLNEPKDCSWDGDGTVFVTDSSSNAVYALPVSVALQPATLVKKVADLSNAYGVAVYEANSPRSWTDEGSANRGLSQLAFAILGGVMFL